MRAKRTLCPLAYSLAEKFSSSSGYEKYGDEEIRCRMAEQVSLESMYNVERDWSDPGCQHQDPYGPYKDKE